ncbi:MAG: hypothetical protein ISS26_00470 [Candidatus Omnitrophica bacterium]|nr:hypothetical protein [Candidatus Omnitrophota bacterium]
MRKIEAGIKVALLIIFVIAVNAAFLIKDFSFSKYSIGRDVVTSYDRRYEAMRDSLPDSGAVGYITDKEPEELFSDSYAVQRFFLTKYALSPLIVVNGIDKEYVVGDFQGGTPQKEEYDKWGLSMVRDFGKGAILFKRKVK